MSKNLNGKNASLCIDPGGIKISERLNRKHIPATLENIRADIKNRVAKHSQYVIDLYDACARTYRLSYSEFRQLLEKRESKGEIRINASNRVLLPATKTPAQTTSVYPKPTCVSEVENSIEQVNRTKDEILVHCLINRSRPLHNPKDKKYLNNRYYAHHNYKNQQIPLDSVCEETLLKGYQFVPGEFRDKHDMGIRNAENWVSQQVFLIEFDDTDQNTLDEFIGARPFLKENAWLLTESIRSQYNDPNDNTCNGQLRPRIVFCMPVTVNTTDEREWVYEALEKELPGCDTGSANSITNGGLGNASAEHIKIGKIVDTDWFNTAIETGRQKKAEADKVNQERAEAHKRKQAERAAMGFTEREGELPLEALAKTDPNLFLESLGLSLKSEKSPYQHWGRTEKQGDTALSVWQSNHGNWQIRVFANSIPVPPGVSGAMPLTRFYCYHAFNTDIEGLPPDSQQWKDLNAQLASRGFGTWLSDEEFNAKHTKPTQPPITSSDRRGIQPVTTLPPDHPIITSAPTIEVRERPSFPHYSTEERAVVRDVLSLDPDAGWHGKTPVFTTQYKYLHPLTNMFALNGQPSEVETRRVWSTQFEKCQHCGAETAKWIDRYLLTAGVYCDGCHKDYHIGSYLELELKRKLPNSIISEHQGYLGADSAFDDFRLWEPGTLTHLGAAMSTGKSTEINEQIKSLASHGLGKGIIAVPRVSLARFLAHYLREKGGYRDWGLWHEGCKKSDRFIGNFGAIVCLPSLPRAIKRASDVGVERFYIAIDEIDFGYNLLSLSIEQATAIKKCLREAIKSTGLVVSGQTESTLALEAVAEELECEQVQGFYNTAKLADGNVVMHKHANVDGKSTSIVCGAIDDISTFLDEGHNVYVFCSTRRDGDLIADEFQREHPVVYNAYTKGTSRADAVLRNQKLTDSRLFIGTSAAGVGISILDPSARTVIVNGLNYGSRDASMAVQECVRDRGRCGVSFHYTDYAFPLPVKPTENEKVSYYHEAVKRAASRSAHLSPAGIRKNAYAKALHSLADMQIESFVEYHLGKVGNMPVYTASALPYKTKRIKEVSDRRSEIRQNEKEKRGAKAIEFLNQPHLLTSSEIRKLSNNGKLSPDARLAHETANAAAQAVGWDNTIHGYDNGEPKKMMPDREDIDVAISLVEKNINTDKLTKQRRGYLAVHYPKWTAHQFEADLEKSKSQLVLSGSGVEITAINDDRFLGQLLTKLLERITGTIFNTGELANAVREVLQSPTETGRTFGSELEYGALGDSVYRKARFLHIAEDAYIVDWVRAYVSEWYPARIAKNDDCYALCHAKNLDVRLASFSRWLLRHPGVMDNTELKLEIYEATELPDHNTDEKNNARCRREAGETIQAIAEALEIHANTVSKWCKGIKPLTPVQIEILDILGDGAVWKRSDIEARSRFARRNITSSLNALLEADKICKPKRGYYQKK